MSTTAVKSLPFPAPLAKTSPPPPAPMARAHSRVASPPHVAHPGERHLASPIQLSVLRPPKRCGKRVTRVVAARPAISLVARRLAAGEPFVNRAGNASRAYHLAKRTLDIVGALGLLAVLGPLMLVIYCALWATTRGQPLFVQKRVGHLGRTFPMFKFRTMHLDAEHRKQQIENESDGPVFKNRRDPRITRIGRLLRRTSLDETPQLFNVLRGEMALVGPRPLVVPEVLNFAPWQRQRLAVMPGLTCLWQVSGRSEIAFDDWVRMDLWYIRHQSLWTDCKLLFYTPWSVLSCRGAY